jgi:two-component system cell cycle response regulator DivK
MAAPRVLVVDDFLDGREMVVEYLRFRGFDAYEATCGAEAIALAATLQPRVILMDLAMANVDGWEATRRIKADPRTKDIIVIAVTAHALAPDEAVARKAGCDGYIAKPYDIAWLGDLLIRTLQDGPRVLVATDAVLARTDRQQARRQMQKRKTTRSSARPKGFGDGRDAQDEKD